MKPRFSVDQRHPLANARKAVPSWRGDRQVAPAFYSIVASLIGVYLVILALNESNSQPRWFSLLCLSLIACLIGVMFRGLWRLRPISPPLVETLQPPAFRGPTDRRPFLPVGLPMRFEGDRAPIARPGIMLFLADFARTFLIVGLFAAGWFAFTILGLALTAEAAGWSGGPPRLSRLAAFALLIAGTIGVLSWSIRRLHRMDRRALPTRARVSVASPASGRSSLLYDRDLDGGL
jgi:hypothetical protein